MSFDVKTRTRLAAVGLVLLYVCLLSPYWKIGRDSALYLGLGQSLAEGNGFAFAGVHYEKLPFGWPFIVAAVFRAVGPNYLLLNSLMMVMALITLWAVYKTVKEIAGEWWALIVSVLTGLTFRMVQDAGQLLTDIPAMMFCWMAFFFLQRFVLRTEKRWINALAAGLALMTACTFRLSSPFFLPAFALVPWLSRTPGQSVRNRLIGTALLVLPAVVLLFLWFQHKPEAGTTGVVSSYVVPATTNVLARWQSLLVDSAIAVASLSELVLTQSPNMESALAKGVSRSVPGAAFLFGFVGVLLMGAIRVSRRDRGLSLIASVFYFLGVAGCGVKPNPRYLLPLLPFLWWFFAKGLEAIRQRLTRDKRESAIDAWPLAKVCTIALSILLVMHVAQIARRAYSIHATDYYAAYEKGHWKPYLEVSGWIRAHSETGTRAVSPENRVVAYLSERHVLRNPRNARQGDLIVVGQRSDRSADDGPLLDAAWRLIDAGLTEEVFHSGELTVHRVKHAPGQG